MSDDPVNDEEAVEEVPGTSADEVPGTSVDEVPGTSVDAANDGSDEVPGTSGAAAGPAAARPLEGVLVVDLSRYLPGPLVTRILADLGARVLKVEEPKLGDPSRQAPPSVDGKSSLSALLLAGHESLALDLKKPTARDLVEDMLMSADVLVESLRPGGLASMGLDPSALRKLYPKLVICSVTGFGQDGPHAARAGHDLTYQALAGSLAGGTGMPAIQTADVVGGWSGAAAVLAALYRREQTGRGCWIDQSLLDAAGHSAFTAWAAEANGPKAVGEPLPLTGGIVCYDLYRTRDDQTIALAALEPKFWKRLWEALDERDLISRQFSDDPADRRRVAKVVARRTRDEWRQIFDRHDIPAEPVLSPSEALEHPQVQHRGMLRRADDGLLRAGYPALIDGERPRGGDAFPGLGEHTEPVLRELGLATSLSPMERRRGGVGKRFSWRRLASRVAQTVASRRKGD